MRSLLDFSVCNPPAPGRLMAVLKAYLDDSGDPKDPAASFVTIGGYVAEADSWAYFEELWAKALAEAGVPYFHMKEFGDRNGLYRDLKRRPRAESEFVASLVFAITSSADLCPVNTVRLADLAAFNAATGLSLDPYALDLYGCMIAMRREYPGAEIEVVVDRFDKAMSRMETALTYARMHRGEDLEPERFIPVFLQDDESFKNVTPIQAADFIAWEVRKSCEERKNWSFTQEERLDRQAMRESYERWAGAYERKHGRPPRARKSYERLREVPFLNPRGLVWDQLTLRQAHERHPDGWA